MNVYFVRVNRLISGGNEICFFVIVIYLCCLIWKWYFEIFLFIENILWYLKKLLIFMCIDRVKVDDKSF